MTLMTISITPLYGMNIPQSLSGKLENKALSEQEILLLLNENKDYEQLLIKEKEDFRGMLVYQMIKLGQKIPSHLLADGDYSVSWLQEINAGLLSRAIENKHTLLINFLVEKNINLCKPGAERLLIDSMKKNVLQQYVLGSEEENDQKRLVEFLIVKGVNVDKVLGAAVLAGYPLVVEVSVKNGANIDGVNSDFRPLNTAVFLHVENTIDRSDTIKILLDAGADTKLLNKKGESLEGMIKEKSVATQQTDWAQIILAKNSLPEPNIGGNPDNNNSLPNPHIGGNPDNNHPLPNPHVGGNPDNNPTPSVFNLIKQNKGFAFVGAVIGAGVIVWGCKKLYAKYQEYTKQQEQADDSEQVEQEEVVN